MNLIEELSLELKKINISLLTINDIEEIIIHKSINKHSRYIGSEFDKTLKKIILSINDLSIFRFASYQIKHDAKKEIIGIYNGKYERNYYDSNFDLETFLKYYDFQSRFSYNIKNNIEKKEIQKHLNFMFKKIDINVFKATKKVMMNVKINAINNLNFGFADVIIDDRLIDIKSGYKIKGKNKENISQLLFYFFMINISVSHFSKKRSINIHKINKIGFYYSAYNRLIEVDVQKLIPNLNVILNLIKQLLIQGNVSIREVINTSLNNVKNYNVLTDEQLKLIDEACIEIERIEAERCLLEKNERKLEISNFKLFKEYKKLGLTKEEIIKLLDFLNQPTQ
jgi:hypothetical protein